MGFVVLYSSSSSAIAGMDILRPGQVRGLVLLSLSSPAPLVSAARALTRRSTLPHYDDLATHRHTSHAVGKVVLLMSAAWPALAALALRHHTTTLFITSHV